MNDNASASLPARDLVLIGAGHTNLHIVRMWRMQPIEGVQLTLVSPFSRATYSGMLPGTLAGHYRSDEMEIDLWRLCQSCGVRLVVDEAIGFDADVYRVLFADRPPLRYDVASIGIGSTPAGLAAAPHSSVLSIKPMATFRDRFVQRLAAIVGVRGGASNALVGGENRLPLRPDGVPTEPVRVAIVGAGAGGTEVAFGLEAELRTRGVGAEVLLIDGGAEILPGYAPGTIRRARKELARRAIVVCLGKRVVDVWPEPTGVATELMLDDGSRCSADIIVWATSAGAPPVLVNFQLPKTDAGFLAARNTLQSTADVPVFVVGDTADIVGERVPKAGLYAVRQGPVLWDNLQRCFAGRSLRPFEPQRGFLSLVSTGDGRALLDYHGLSIHGRWAWLLKDHIDRKFMRMYQDYRPRRAPLPHARGVSPLHPSSSQDGIPNPMRCTGCGSKVAGDVLTAALERLRLPPTPGAAAGLELPDDAVVLDRQVSPVDVLSVDFFPAFLDDPYLVGRIAALHALSDLWAMGAEPLGALALVTLPPGSQRQQTELLYQLLAGGVRELAAADASLWGGHTTEGPELVLGYSVAGKLEGRQPFTKGSLRSGDRLILTKPLGAATLLAAHRECRCPARWMDALLARMLESNEAASRIAREFSVSAATDVTGFGLAGHLWEMLDASDVSARLSLSAIPILEGFADLSAAGFRSSLDPANRRLASRLQVDRVADTSHPAYPALFDPQTSGGLLIGISGDRAEALCGKLIAAGCSSASIVGTIHSAGLESELEIWP